jgi:hypothetical protein
MKKKPQVVGSMLGGLIRGIEAAYPDAGHRIWEIWSEAVGPEIAARTAPLEFRKGRLTVAVSGASWVQQLTLLSPQIIEAVNKALDKPLEEPLVRSMRFRQASVTPPEPVAPPEEPWQDEPLSEEETREVEAGVEGIRDEGLAQAIRRARAMFLRRHKRQG